MVKLIKNSLNCLVLSISGIFLFTFFAFGQAESFEKGKAAHKNKDYEAALIHFQEAWEISRAQLGDKDPTTLNYNERLSSTHFVIGKAGLDKSNFQLAEYHFQKAWVISKARLGEKDPKALSYASWVSRAYQGLGKYKEALSLNQSTLEFLSQQLPENHEDILSTKSRIASNYESLSNSQAALKINEEVYSIRKKTLGENDPKTIEALYKIGYNYLRLGKLKEGLEIEIKVTEFNRAKFGAKDYRTINSTAVLATIYNKLGDYEKSIKLREEVLSLRQEKYGEKSSGTLTAMGDLTLSYISVGRYADALLLSEKAVKLGLEIHGPNHASTLNAKNNLSLCYSHLGRYQDSLNLREQLVNDSIQALGLTNYYTLNNMSNLAADYIRANKNKDALDLSKKVFDLRVQVLGKNHNQTLETMAILASSYNRNGENKKALEVQKELLILRSEILGEKNPLTLQTMSGIADTLGRLGETQEQLELQKKVYALRKEVLGIYHPNTLQIIDQLARTYQKINDISAAANLSSEYVTGAEMQRQQGGLSTENKRSIFSRYVVGYRNFSSLQAENNHIDEAFKIAELSKARTLLESMANKNANQSSTIPINDQKSLESYTNKIEAINQSMEKSDSNEEKRNLELMKNDLIVNYQTLQKSLKEKYPKYAQLTDVKIISKEDLNQLIPKNSIAISYLINGEKISAFVIDSNGNLKFEKLPELKNISDTIEIARKYISVGDGFTDAFSIEGKKAWQLPNGSYKLQDITQPGPKDAVPLILGRKVIEKLSQSLIEPLEPYINASSQLVISPDGPLSQLPFEILETKTNSSNLISQKSIQYTQSLSTYALSKNLQIQLKNIPNRKSLLAVGNPEYLNAPQENSTRQLTRNAAISNLDKVTDLDTLWNPLPGTEVEVKKISALFPNSNKVLLGKEATEQNMQQLNQSGEIKNYKYILMSAHGYLSPNQPALSSIVLGLKNKLPSADGYITALEWSEYNLRSDLTVLSACDSGIGKVINGEGVMGLPFALFVAGNVNTILSLWPVDDEATAIFMETFFKKLKSGESTTDALKNTKHNFIKSIQYSDPKYWSPFILVGAG